MESNRYAVGPITDLVQVFPGYDVEHARKSLDGSLAIFSITSEMDYDEDLLASSDIMMMTHEEVTDVLGGPESIGVWREDEPVPDVPGFAETGNFDDYLTNEEESDAETV